MIGREEVKLFGFVFVIINILFFSVHFLFLRVPDFVISFDYGLPWWLNNLIDAINWSLIITSILVLIHKRMGEIYYQVNAPKRFTKATFGGFCISFLIRWTLIQLGMNSVIDNTFWIILIILLFCLIAFGYFIKHITAIGIFIGGCLGISLIFEVVNGAVVPSVVVVGMILFLFPKKTLDSHFR